MNIFYLHRDPHEAARLQCDRHVVKMILEYCQLLSTACRSVRAGGECRPELAKEVLERQISGPPGGSSGMSSWVRTLWWYPHFERDCRAPLAG